MIDETKKKTLFCWLLVAIGIFCGFAIGEFHSSKTVDSNSQEDRILAELRLKVSVLEILHTETSRRHQQDMDNLQFRINQQNQMLLNIAIKIQNY